MKRTPISSESSNVTLTQNIVAANVPTPVLTFEVPIGGEFVIPNQFQGRNGPQTGFSVTLDLNKANGTRISGTSIISFQVMGPNWESPKEVRRIPYSLMREISRVLQSSADYVEQIASQIDLNVDYGHALPQRFKFIIAVQGPDQVDWTKSYVSFKTLEGKPGEFTGLK